LKQIEYHLPVFSSIIWSLLVTSPL